MSLGALYLWDRSKYELVNAERQKWAYPHSLNYDPELRAQHLQLLNNFGFNLRLCYQECYSGSITYQHWFVTDGTWIIEFGGEELLYNAVIVHSNPRRSFIIDSHFQMTPEVKLRMNMVCGSANYSLALRNCEHVARYIYCGRWLCFQMTHGTLKDTLFNYLGEKSKLINVFPKELEESKERKIEKLYKDLDDSCGLPMTYERKHDHLTDSDNNAFNILFLGPTGAGKSTLINHLFNRTVCKTGGAAISTTKQARFHSGSHHLWSTHGEKNIQRRTKVNVCDTIGKENSNC